MPRVRWQRLFKEKSLDTNLRDYFENVEGIGVLGTADAEGNADLSGCCYGNATVAALGVLNVTLSRAGWA